MYGGLRYYFKGGRLNLKSITYACTAPYPTALHNDDTHTDTPVSRHGEHPDAVQCERKAWRKGKAVMELGEEVRSRPVASAGIRGVL